MIIDSELKETILQKILSENSFYQEGNIFFETKP